MIKRRPTAHPVPGYAAKAVEAATMVCLHKLAQEVEASIERGISTEEWIDFKFDILRTTLRTKREQRRRLTNTLRQKERRLRKRLMRAEQDAHTTSTTMAAITDMMEDLTLVDDAGGSSVATLRRALAETQRQRQQRTARSVFLRHSLAPKQTSKSLHARVSLKYGDNFIPRLTTSCQTPLRTGRAKVNVLADAWFPIIQEPAGAEADKEAFFAGLPQRIPLTPGLFGGLMDSITVEEVTEATNHLSTGTTPSPDRIPNSWYKRHSETLGPILASLLTERQQCLIFPASFKEADIFCLKKAGDATDPTNYRSLALLDTDYKTYTRILATRTRSLLSNLIHHCQNGFVPERSIHATIYYLEAAIKAAHDDPRLYSALAILMDIRKAYDTLDPEFLLQALRYHGFPEQNISVVAEQHRETVVRFLVNGERSRPVNVTRGIRQRCPLAPLLFILALDLFYRALGESSPQLGIDLRTRTEVARLIAAGYADDTTAYLDGPERISCFVAIADAFGAASGLHLHRDKTVVIPLAGDRAPANIDTKGLPQLHLGATSRYLCIRVGGATKPDDNWESVFKALGVRLAQAEARTHTPARRYVLATSIIISKLLNVARHSCRP